MNDRLRRVFFTWNNWDKDFKDKEEVTNYFLSLTSFQGALIGFEIGEKGTPHLQGILQYKNQKTFNNILIDLKKNHIEKIRNINASVDYCKKAGDFIELGEEINIQGKRHDLKEWHKLVLEGTSEFELMELYPHLTLKYSDKIPHIRSLERQEIYKKKRRLDLLVIYIGGVAGVGKTRFVYDNYEDDMYVVSNYKNPFDSYNAENVLVLDEYNNQFKLQEMLKVLDIYPIKLRSRYSDKTACYNYVFIISNLSYQDFLNENTLDNELRNALDRRVHYKVWLNKVNYDKEIEKLKDFLHLYDNLAF